MHTEDVLYHPSKVLTEAQRHQYFEQGFLVLESFIDSEWVERINDVTNEFLERSRAVTESNDVFDLAPEHTAASPRLRRIKSPDAQHETYWAYAQDVIADVAADLLGPDVLLA